MESAGQLALAAAVVVAVLAMHWRMLRAWRDEQTAERAAHERHIRGIMRQLRGVKRTVRRLTSGLIECPLLQERRRARVDAASTLTTQVSSATAAENLESK